MDDKKMTESEKLLSMAPDRGGDGPDYQDDELMIIDNVKLLGLPDAVQPNMNILAFCSKGRMSAELNGEPLEVNADEIFVCPPEIRITNLMVSTDFEYQALCITNHALQIFLRQHINVWNQVLYIKKRRIFHFRAEDSEFYAKSYDLLRLCMKTQVMPEENAFQREIIKGLLSTLLIGFCYFLKHEVSLTDESPRQNISIFNRFLQMLQSAEQKHRSVEYYASQLFISSKYLTVICKKNSNKTANDWIREYTMSDITYFLRNTDLSIKEICAKLGFPNPSFFGKYVKEHFGCTPLEYRMQRQ